MNNLINNKYKKEVAKSKKKQLFEEILGSKKINYSSYNNTCLICLNTPQNKCLTPCKHLYCQDCLASWLQNNSNCPICKYVFN